MQKRVLGKSYEVFKINYFFTNFHDFSEFFMIFQECLEIKTAKIKEEVGLCRGHRGPFIVRYVALS